MQANFNIFKQLTKNLSFSKEKPIKPTIESAQQTILLNEEPLQDAAKAETITKTKSKKRKLDLIEEDSHSAKFNLLSSVEIDTAQPKQAKKLKTKSDKKKLEKIKIEQVNHVRNLHHINVFGEDIPDPVEQFSQLKSSYKNIPDQLVANLAEFKFSQPTGVQMQAIPVMLNNRELLVCAPTGSGKTISYLFPLLANLKTHKKKGIRAVILSPTRELARQIFIECCTLTKNMSLKPHLVNKHANELKRVKFYEKKYDILISTPNKLISLLEEEQISACLKRVEWMIIDEADKLFEAGSKNGFREQLAKIYSACDNPKIKHGMFSATISNEVEEWCKSYMNNLVQITIGRKNLAATSVEQELLYVGTEQGKLIALKQLLKQGFQPPILVFVQSKERVTDLFKELVVEFKSHVDMISADRSQPERDNTIRAFRQGKLWILISTELMSRGIDFKHVNLVVNYDIPLSRSSYIHRVGRSGRGGNLGRAVTFFTDSDLAHVRTIANVIKEAGCEVPDFMLKLKKASKKEKRKLEVKAPKRKKISRC